MKSVDLKSTLVAGVFGAAILTAIVMICNSNQYSYSTLGMGFAVGAGVQVGVRLFGVS